MVTGVQERIKEQLSGQAWDSDCQPSLPDPQETEASLQEKWGRPPSLIGRIGTLAGRGSRAEFDHYPSVTSYDYQQSGSIEVNPSVPSSGHSE